MEPAPRRIWIVGNTGSGKSTLARAAAARLGVPSVEMDSHYWDANWTPFAEELFVERVRQATAGEGWVVEGNYFSKTSDYLLSRIDTFVWLRTPFPLNLWRLLRRTLRRIRSGEELWAGNRETARKAFLSRDSLFLWAIDMRRTHLARYGGLRSDPRLAGIQWVELRSTREAEQWLASLAVPPNMMPRS